MRSKTSRRSHYNHKGLLLVVALLSLPLGLIALSLVTGYSKTWAHIASHLLPDYLLYSALIAATVAFGALMLGVGSAWLVTMYDFPYRQTLQWLLMLPIALPAYILAYTYTGISYDLGWSFLGALRSWYGASTLLILVSYPYVYAACRVAFAAQDKTVVEAARNLGCSMRAVFMRVALPIARPAIVGGISLVVMEALAEYGTMELFGIPTLTTGIFRTWFGYGELRTAAQLSALLLFAILLVLLLEQLNGRSKQAVQNQRGVTRSRPRTRYAYLYTAACSIPVLFGLVVPAVFLLKWTVQSASIVEFGIFLSALTTSCFLGASVALIAISLSLFCCYYRRYNPTVANKLLLKAATFGYALPGTVIAIGVMIPSLFFQDVLIAFAENVFGFDIGLLITGTLAALIIALVVRYLSVGINTIASSLDSIDTALDESAHTLGHARRQTEWLIHRPMLLPSVASAAILLFVDVVKELPATLILRPFNTTTLSVKVFEYASDERLLEAALPALTIVLISVLPVLYLNRFIDRREGAIRIESDPQSGARATSAGNHNTDLQGIH